MLTTRSRSAHAARRNRKFDCRPLLEKLEGRLLMAGLDVPVLSSRPGAAATIYLDFDGHFQSSWGSFSNITSPAYSRDTDVTAFSASDLAGINEIWARVSEDFAPFNVNVTTVEPPSFDNGVALRVVIGGRASDWFGGTATGAAVLNSFTSADPNVVYVFPGNLSSGFPKWVAEAVSRYSGTSLGLLQQAKWSGSVLQEAFSTGTGEWAPIMGNGNFAQRSTWHNGPTNVSPSSFQFDMAVIANHFGYVADDHGDSLNSASNLPITGTSVNLSGMIGETGDQDAFRFTTAGGNLSFNLAVASVGANLDSVLELRDANGLLIAVANDTTSGVYSSALSANVAAGTYYLVVRASGGYGNVGRYTLTGTVVPGVVTAPEISIVGNGTELTSGGTFSFGSTLVGTPVSQTFTVQNFGNGDLTLTALNPSSLPAGFSLVTNFGSTTLAPGQSTTFTLRLDASAVGDFGGVLHVLSNDADEGSFDIVLNGHVLALPKPEIRVWSGPNEKFNGDSQSFGPVLINTLVTHTFTVQNVGDGDLVIQDFDEATLAAGFSLAQNLNGVTLHPTELITFTVRFNASAPGQYLGNLRLVSNDEDEGTFDIVLHGVATAPEIRITGSPELNSGDVFDFGTTLLGTPVQHTFTIHNAGDGDLVVSAIDAGAFPAGFSLVGVFDGGTVVPGATATFTVRLDATALGTFGGPIYVHNSDSDEGSFAIVLTGSVVAPEISVYDGAAELSDGGTVTFSPTQTGTPLTKTITITNTGSATLSLQQLDGAAMPAGFSLVQPLSALVLAAGHSATFVVRLDAAAAGSPSGVIHIISDDADEASFDITLQGTVNDPPPPPPTEYTKTIDNGEHGFETSGRWHRQKYKGGYERDIHFAEKAGKKDKKLATASWKFKCLDAGTYRVWVTFPKSPSYASNAPFTIYDGETAIATVLVNQKRGLVGGKTGPGKREEGVQWLGLGSFRVQGDKLVVQLTNRANGHVVADAVKIERVADEIDPVLSLPPMPEPAATTTTTQSTVVIVTSAPETSTESTPTAPAATTTSPEDFSSEQLLLEQSTGLLDELATDLALNSTLN